MQNQRLLTRSAATLVGVCALLLVSGCLVPGEQADESPSPSSATPEAGGPPPAGEGEPANEQPVPGPLMLVMDASGSMNETGPDGQLRIDSAKQALHDLVNALPAQQHVGLRVYGHRVPNTDKENGCQDTELIHSVAPLDRDALNRAVDGYDAVGYTPIGLSLEEAAGDLPPEGNRTIVLVSDGEDTCAPPHPCDVARNLNQAGVELIVNTVGFALGANDQARQELECIAEAGGGVFQDAETAADLADALAESTRDRREAQLVGGVMEGAPLPRDANTGQVNTPYQDTVLGFETNYYRFEVPAGSEVQAEVIGRYDREVQSCPAAHAKVVLTDAGGEDLYWRTRLTVAAGTSEPHRSKPVELETTEVWLKIETVRDRCATAEVQLEIQLTVR